MVDLPHRTNALLEVELRAFGFSSATIEQARKQVPPDLVFQTWGLSQMADRVHASLFNWVAAIERFPNDRPGALAAYDDACDYCEGVLLQKVSTTTHDAPAPRAQTQAPEDD